MIHSSTNTTSKLSNMPNIKVFSGIHLYLLLQAVILKKYAKTTFNKEYLYFTFLICHFPFFRLVSPWSDSKAMWSFGHRDGQSGDQKVQQLWNLVSSEMTLANHSFGFKKSTFFLFCTAEEKVDKQVIHSFSYKIRNYQSSCTLPNLDNSLLEWQPCHSYA